MSETMETMEATIRSSSDAVLVLHAEYEGEHGQRAADAVWHRAAANVLAAGRMQVTARDWKRAAHECEASTDKDP